jgi:hypothetical protein
MYENVHYLVFTVLKRVHAVVTLYAAMTFLSVHRQSSGFSLSANFSEHGTCGGSTVRAGRTVLTALRVFIASILNIICVYIFSLILISIL